MNWASLLANGKLLQNGILINGQWLTDERETFDVINPANRQVIATISKATKEDLKEAVFSAKQAQLKWQLTPLKERCQILENWYNLIEQNIDDLAKILTLEQGKPFIEAKGEISYGASYIKWYAEESRRIYGSLIPANQNHTKLIVEYEPVGVCAAITPWNFPQAMLARKVAPALAAACAMIAKPASQTPLSANALAYLALDAGVPAGLFNVVHGHSGNIGEFLCNEKAIRKLSFTGSTEVGVWLYQNSANTMKKLSLELGGNAPLIVFADADLDKAVAGIMQSKFRNNGQTCVCANRIFLHHSIKDQLIEKLCQKITSLKLGNGLDKDTDLGPLIDNNALLYMDSLIQDALKHGSHVICGGKVDPHLGGLFYLPTVIDCPNTDARIFKEEIFGPLLAIYSFSQDDEVIDLANNTSAGLASYLFSENVSTVFKVAKMLNFGIVGINSGLISNENAPFGGVKMSGLGREGGQQGLLEYLQTKYICLDLS